MNQKTQGSPFNLLDIFPSLFRAHSPSKYLSWLFNVWLYRSIKAQTLINDVTGGLRICHLSKICLKLFGSRCGSVVEDFTWRCVHPRPEGKITSNVLISHPCIICKHVSDVHYLARPCYHSVHPLCHTLTRRGYYCSNPLPANCRLPQMFSFLFVLFQIHLLSFLCSTCWAKATKVMIRVEDMFLYTTS